jgi:ribosome biogenesis protein SSF1/2
MPYRGGRRTKTRTHKKGAAGEAEAALALGAGERVPRSFVLRRGKVDGAVRQLVADVREMMQPHTSARLRERKSNTLRDFVAVAGPLGVTHMLLFSQTDAGAVGLRVGRLAQGPTLSFRLEAYSLSRQIKAAQRRPVDVAGAFLSPPLVVLHNFAGAGAGAGAGDGAAPPSSSSSSSAAAASAAGVTLADALKMTMVTFQALFPAINPATVRLAECRRVLLVHYDRATGCIELRHYAVRAAPVGVSRGVKKVLQSRPPDLGELDDVADFVLSGGRTGGGGGGATSESEFEDESSHVVLPQGFSGRGNARAQQSAIKLAEIGPRLRLSLVKIEGGLFGGEVLHHAHVTKSSEEAAELRRRAADKDRLKLQRRAQQDANVRRKEAEKATKKVEKDALRAKRQRAAVAAAAEGRGDGGGEEENAVDSDEIEGEGVDEDEGEEVDEDEDEDEDGDEGEDEDGDEDEDEDENEVDDEVNNDVDEVVDEDEVEGDAGEAKVGARTAAGAGAEAPVPPAPRTAGTKRGREKK